MHFLKVPNGTFLGHSNVFRGNDKQASPESIELAIIVRLKCSFDNFGGHGGHILMTTTANEFLQSRKKVGIGVLLLLWMRHANDDIIENVLCGELDAVIPYHTYS